MLGGVVNAADKRHGTVDHHNLTVHPAENVGAHTQQRRARIVVAEHDAGGGELADELIAKIGRAVAIQQYLNIHPALGGTQQHGVQLAAHVVVKPDKGFQDHLTLCLLNGFEHSRVVFVTVLQQLDAVSFSPSAFHR